MVASEEADSSDITIKGPFGLFESWLEDAVANEPNDSNAMAHATVDCEGLPNVPMVLLNRRDAHGFVFFSDIGSAKGEELASAPKAAAVFRWRSLSRRGRLRGPVEQIGDAEAGSYSRSRSRLSQIAAWASHQSCPLEERFALETAVAELYISGPHVKRWRYSLGSVPRALPGQASALFRCKSISGRVGASGSMGGSFSAAILCRLSWPKRSYTPGCVLNCNIP